MNYLQSKGGRLQLYPLPLSTFISGCMVSFISAGIEPHGSVTGLRPKKGLRDVVLSEMLRAIEGCPVSADRLGSIRMHGALFLLGPSASLLSLTWLTNDFSGVESTSHRDTSLRTCEGDILVPAIDDPSSSRDGLFCLLMCGLVVMG